MAYSLEQITETAKLYNRIKSTLMHIGYFHRSNSLSLIKEEIKKYIKIVPEEVQKKLDIDAKSLLKELCENPNNNKYANPQSSTYQETPYTADQIIETARLYHDVASNEYFVHHAVYIGLLTLIADIIDKYKNKVPEEVQKELKIDTDTLLKKLRDRGIAPSKTNSQINNKNPI